MIENEGRGCCYKLPKSVLCSTVQAPSTCARYSLAKRWQLALSDRRTFSCKCCYCYLAATSEYHHAWGRAAGDRLVAENTVRLIMT